MYIYNNTNKKNYAWFNSDWSGRLIGNDGYPNEDKQGDYLIAGGEDRDFKAIAIEFYGVKTLN